MNPGTDPGDMGKEDRKRMILNLLAESGFALPPVVIFRNAKLRGATFERRSVNNYLEELAEEGFVKKVNPKELDNGNLVTVDMSESGYFVVTENGRKEVNSSD